MFIKIFIKGVLIFLVKVSKFSFNFFFLKYLYKCFKAFNFMFKSFNFFVFVLKFLIFLCGINFFFKYFFKILLNFIFFGFFKNVKI